MELLNRSQPLYSVDCPDPGLAMPASPSEFPQARPLFKYIGGKSWLRGPLRDAVREALRGAPADFASRCRYVEPFAGGLGSFLSVQGVLRERGIHRVTLCDINPLLIGVYGQVAAGPSALLREVSKLEAVFAKAVPSSGQWSAVDRRDKDAVRQILAPAADCFAQVRSDFNASRRRRSLPGVRDYARLVFLQKHSFNGIYRENGSGDYNTPFNWSPSVMGDDIHRRVHALNRVFSGFDVEFRSGSFEELDFAPDWFCYLDPPYMNESITENKYSGSGFGLDQQMSLLDRIRGLPFVYSNHDLPVLRKGLEGPGVTIGAVGRSNTISASGAARSDKIQEILAISRPYRTRKWREGWASVQERDQGE